MIPRTPQQRGTPRNPQQRGNPKTGGSEDFWTRFQLTTTPQCNDDPQRLPTTLLDCMVVQVVHFT